MAVIERNEHGAVGVNKTVIQKMIIKDLLSKSDRLVLCNKKGKLIKDNPTPWIDPDHYDAIDVIDKRGSVRVRINIVVIKGNNISKLSEEIFQNVEDNFELLRLSKPQSIRVKVRGLLSDELVRKDIEIVRRND